MTSLQMFAMTSHMLTIQSDIIVPMSSIPCRDQMAHVIKSIRVETIQCSSLVKRTQARQVNLSKMPERTDMHLGVRSCGISGMVHNLYAEGTYFRWANCA